MQWAAPWSAARNEVVDSATLGANLEGLPAIRSELLFAACGEFVGKGLELGPTGIGQQTSLT
jgi:hypothetical protein